MPASEPHRTILMADIGNSTALYETLGDTAAHRLVSQSLDCMQACIEGTGGVLLRTVGDAALACFDSPDQALAAACRMQQRHRELGLAIRVGFHSGAVIEDKGDVYGTAVNVAARVADFAEPGEIVATAEVVDGLPPPARHRCRLLDTVPVKGIQGRLTLYRIVTETDADEAATHLVQPLQRRVLAPALPTLTLTINGQARRYARGGVALHIGRAQDNDVVCESDRVSRHHLCIESRAAQWVLTDASSNGTYLQRSGQAVLFVRREAVVLDGEGYLGLGDPVARAGAAALGFRIEPASVTR